MAASKGSRIASLILRILTFCLIFISLLINATNSKTVFEGTEAEYKIRFKDIIYAYRYLISVAVIGAALSLLKIALALHHVITKSDGTPLFDVFSDSLLSYLLLSGASAGLGSGIDLKPVFHLLFEKLFDTFLDKGNAAAAILLIAFVCSAIVSILSALALRNKP